MLRSLEEILGYGLMAEDGDIGHVEDVLFDDHDWVVRYVVVDTGKWISRKKVLLARASIEDPDWPARKLPVRLTKHEIEESLTESAHEASGSGDPHLRSFREVEGYSIAAKDGEVGHVEDLMVDDEEWTIRYMVVDTGGWLSGRKVLVSPTWLLELSASDQEAVVDLTRAQIEASPEYEAEGPIYRAYEAELHEEYGRRGYWET